MDDSVTARAQYEELSSEREPYLTRARQHSILTVKYLIPQVEFDNGASTEIQTYNNLGSRAISYLSSKLMLALFPPSEIWAKHEVEANVVTKMPGDQVTQMRADLAKADTALMRGFDKLQIRNECLLAIQHGLIAGNGCLFLPLDDKRRHKLFPIDRYVIDRDQEDNLQTIITHERFAYRSLSREMQALAVASKSASEIEMLQTGKLPVDVYTCVFRQENGTWSYFQELNDITVPGTDGVIGKSQPLPWIVFRGVRVSGEMYGRAFVEDNIIDDLRSLDALWEQALNIAAIKGFILTAIKRAATGALTPDILSRKRSGDYIIADEGDIWTVEAGKDRDMRAVLDTIGLLTQRVSRACLMFEGVERDAERVTTEEIRVKIQELQTGTGSLYAVQTEELQLPLLRVLRARMEKAGTIPKFPPDVVDTTIVTGLEALGRGNDVEKLRGWVADIVEMPALAKWINEREFMLRTAAARGLSTEGLVKTAEQMAQEQQQEQLAEMGRRSASTMVGKMADQLAPPPTA